MELKFCECDEPDFEDVDCPYCNGTGESFDHSGGTCRRCGGSGVGEYRECVNCGGVEEY